METYFLKTNITIKTNFTMKNILKYITLLLVFITSKSIAQTPATITKTDYTVTGTETLIATESITLKPNTWIKTGSTFLATVNSDAYIPLSFSNENYIFTRTFQTPMSSVSGISKNKDVIELITYFDGLGRPMQSIGIKGSPSKEDIITYLGYDGFGRQDKEYLPYREATGSIASYRTAADAAAKAYYSSNYAADINPAAPNPFSEKSFENSPLNRVLMQGAPGSGWAINSGHEIKTDYLANIPADNVKLFTAVTTWNATQGLYDIALGNSTGTVFYGANQLYKTVVKNENWTSGNNNTTEEFKDKEGRVILKKTYGTSIVNNVPVNTPHETYYVYDDYGNLTYVMPPKADGNITPAVLNDFCYQYRYDDRNRLVEKKLPGKEWEYIVYDKLDRPVLTQDANLKALNKWIFTKYDAFNRPVYTGEYVNAAARNTVQASANSSTTLLESRQTSALNINGTNVNYSNNAFPNTAIAIDLLTINYYDDYLNIDLDGGTIDSSYGITPITNAKGLSTCSKVRILGTTSWTTTVNYYDAKGRPIYNYSKNNYLTTTSTVKTQLDFGGKILETTSTHKKGTDALITLTDVFSYDHTGRLLTQKQTINGQTQEVIASNTYDNLGQLTLKGVGGKITQSRLQNVTYDYNIRGWLKNINNVNSIGNTLFAFQINYNTPSTGTALFNGNISQTLWKTANNDSSLKTYSYTYDALNRLTQGTDNSANAGRYNEGLSYDKNGNIMSLLRTGNTNAAATAFGTMDNLVYSYDTGNKLVKVEDSSGSTEGFNNGSNTAVEYTYDSNGNMKTDANKGITAVTYNYLNLPLKVTLSTGSVDYVYDASGVKQRKAISTGGSTDYAGSFVYENNALKQFAQPEGYVVYNSGVFNYIYQYKDHLGNIRLSYQDKDNNGVVNNTEIVQESNYYPFGLTQKGYNGVVNGVDNKYKYNGKELQDESIGGIQLNLYDYGARNYDPALGRWMNIDPKAEMSRRFSPYTYALNNPIYFIDPDGMMAYPPIGLDARNGQKHVDGDGVWIYSAATTTWVGQYGNRDGTKSEDIGNTIELNNVNVKGYKSNYVSSGEYGPDKDPVHAAMAAGVVVLPVLAAEGALVAGGAYLWGETTAAYSAMTTESALIGMGANASSQYAANGGSVGDINIIEMGTSAVPSFLTTAFGETFSYSFNNFMKDEGIQKTDSLTKWSAQVGGGLLSHGFGKVTDSYLGNSAGDAFVGEYFKWQVETVSNVVPNTIK
jgi:RHS repeat-associated protein